MITQKLKTNIHNVEHFENRTKVSFDFSGNHSDYVTLANQITEIERKHTAQSTLYSNSSSLVIDNKVNVIGLTDGKSGGTITFHSHSCDPKEAASELISLLESVSK